jgi:hypothetical protein
MRVSSELLAFAAAAGCTLATLTTTAAIFVDGSRSMLLAIVRAAAERLV